MGETPLLLAREVVASRPDDAGHRQTVLEKTTLGVAAGELLSIVGPSGSGKSTLLRLFNRLLEPDQGQVLFDGADIRTIDPPALRAKIPLVSQKPYLFAGTVRDNLKAPAKLRRASPPDFQSDDVQNILHMCQVDPAWHDRDARKLSVGQQQRVCLARAMLGPSQALLLDEPTSALDRPTADAMAKSFRQLAADRQLAIIFVTHDLRLAEFCADRIALMLSGSIAEEGPADALLYQPTTAAARQFLASMNEPQRRGRA